MNQVNEQAHKQVHNQPKGKIDLAAAIALLRSHSLELLFIQALGWQRLSKISTDHLQAIQRAAQLANPENQPVCQPLAYRDEVTVWQVSLSQQTLLTTALRQHIYEAVAAPSSVPLVIFVDAAKTRSLWCQSLSETAVYVSSQPSAIWEYRLRRLSGEGGRPINKALFPTVQSDRRAAHPDIFESDVFESLLQHLCEATDGISNISNRQEYSILTMQRLILIQLVQQHGWLAGDTWRLQTLYGQSLQQGKNLFFQTYLQPLYQSLSMPDLERPLALQSQIGTVPFLGHLFEAHRLEQQYEAIHIDDQPFEEILGWLSEQSSHDRLNPWMSGDLGYWLERYWAQQARPKSEYVATPDLTLALSDRTLDRLILTRIHSPQGSLTTLNEYLFNADTRLCRLLIQEILPDLRLVDPACGSGNLLVALHQRLTDIFSILTGYIQQTQDAQLKIWQSNLAESVSATAPDLLQTIQKRILRNILHGVEILAGATETTRWQLSLHMIAIAKHRREIEPLIDLSFNVMTGNSLIGFLTVDEAYFDRINSAGAGDIFQGNLLQPLAADSYQTVLAEKNLALEHYKFRNQTLAEARNIPAYAMAALLREDLLRLNAKAQRKLDILLLNHMSQQLSIQYKAMQLTDKPQRQPLTLEDIDILQPFHWGYHFSEIIQQGGFDGIVCAPPWGAFKPTAAEFFQRFQDLAEGKNMAATDLKTSKQALAKGDPEVAQAWLFYQDQYAYVTDYFYRSDQYAHQNPIADGKPVRNQLTRERLFVERCFTLLAAHGISAVVLPSDLSTEAKAQTLLNYLQKNSAFEEIANMSVKNSEGIGQAAAIAIWQAPPRKDL